MKSLKPKIALTILLLLAACSLTSCDEMDSELMEAVIINWLGGVDADLYDNTQRIITGLTRKAINQTVEQVTNTEESIQLDGFDVIEEIEIADNMSERALENLDTARMASAVKMRPEDWRLQEKDAAVWLANGNAAAAQTAFTKSDEMLRTSLSHGGDCAALRLQQLQTRKQTLIKAEAICANDYSCKNADQLALQAEIAQVNELLAGADSNAGIPAFCDK
jgi:hypothetical protein